MRYSIEPRDTIHVKGYGFLSFAKNILSSKKKHLLLKKNLSNKYGQKLLDSAKKYTYAIKIASKRVIQKQQKQLVI